MTAPVDAGRLGEKMLAFRAQHPPRTVETPRGKWEYIEGGGGERTLLLLPGAPGRADAGFQYFLAFEPEYRVLAPNYPPHPRTVVHMLDGLAAILDAEGVGPFYVQGGSYSGLIAQCMVRRYPQTLTKLILSDTGVPDRARGRRYGRYLRLLKALPTRAIRVLWRMGAGRFLREVREERAFWRAYFRDVASTISKEECVSRLQVWIDFDMQYSFAPGDLSGWQGSMLILEAEGDSTFSKQERNTLCGLYPQARRLSFAGGHAASIARRAEYIEAMRSFLAE